MDLPKAPVLLPREEIDFVSLERETKGIHVVNAHARRLDGRATAIAFEAKPYQTFDESFDVFGDGAVVVVKLFGHTPGSVGTFVSLSPSKRLLHVGDTVNVTEGFERRVAKSFAMAATDHNFGRVGESVAKLAQLHEADPELVILPAHDRLAWQRFFGGEPRCLP